MREVAPLISELLNLQHASEQLRAIQSL